MKFPSNMLKRQRPATPPPSSLDLPTYFSDRLVRPLAHPDLASSTSEPCDKRRRLQRLDHGTLRDLAPSSSDISHEEHGDGEEDAERSRHSDETEELNDGVSHQSTFRGDREYKQTNGILHEVHVLNQHRLIFSPSERPSQSHAHEILPYSDHVRPNPQETTEFGCGLPQSAHSKSPVASNSFQPAHRIRAGQSCSANVADDQADMHEAQAVWERYGGTNKLLGSLFLSRRRELQEAIYSLGS